MRRILALATLLGLAACGAPAAEPAGGTAGDRRTIQTALGPLELAKPATRVVALEWVYVEDLLALGVNPAGVADIKGYHQWVTAGGKVPESTVDVGTRQEPSLEKIKVLQPDLIITDSDHIPAGLDQLKAIAPVAAFQFTDKSRTQLETTRAILTEIARATGREARGAEVLRELDAKATEIKDRLAAAGKANLAYAIAQGYTGQSAPEIRMFTDRSMVGQVLAQAGLRNAWTGTPDDWGMTTVGVEALTQVSDASFLYVAATDDNIFTGPLAGNAVWRNLTFVKDRRVYPLNPGTWFFGGPVSCRQLLDEVAKALGA